MSDASETAPATDVELDPKVAGDLHPFFDELRQRDPVHYGPTAGGWLLTRHRDVSTALRDPRFVPRLHAAPPPLEHEGVLGADQRLRRMFSAAERLVSFWMVFRSPPAHTRLRAVVAPAFAAERIAAMRPWLESMTERLLDAVGPATSFDLIPTLACPLPAATVARLLGIPPDERITRWAPDIAALIDGPGTSASRARGLLAIAESAQYVRTSLDAMRGSGDGLLGALLAAPKSDALEEDELVATAVLLLFAGYETTRLIIPGGVLSLLEHPNQLELLGAEPDLLPSAVEELLRYGSSGQCIWRIAAEDVELGGKKIRRGEVVVLHIGAANRDPEVFADPHRLDLRRRRNPHATFGGGLHYCVGATLARLEVSVAIAALLRRYPRLALAAEPEWEADRQRGLRSLQLATR